MALKSASKYQSLEKNSGESRNVNNTLADITNYEIPVESTKCYKKKKKLMKGKGLTLETAHLYNMSRTEESPSMLWGDEQIIVKSLR
jgi:hypothetical protein